MLWKKVYAQLLDEVNRAQPGEKFYTLRQVCRRYGVSDITARRVLAELQKVGLISRKPRVGSMVTRSVNPISSVRMIIQERVPPTAMLANPGWSRVHSGIRSVTDPRHISFDMLSEQYLPSLNLSSADCGLLVYQKLRPETFQYIKDKRMTAVLLHPLTREEGNVTVRVNMKRGAYLAVQHLLSLGHRRIAFVTSALTSFSLFPRFRGYKKALSEAHVRFDWELIRETNAGEYEEDEALADLLALPEPPTAIFAGNDEHALKLLACCEKSGVRVPDQLSIAGYDNRAETEVSQPPLTTIETHLDQVGKRGVEALLDLAANKARAAVPRNIVIQPDLVIRKTTAPPHAAHSPA